MKTRKVNPGQLIEMVYNICVDNSTLPSKIINEITGLESLKNKIDSGVIDEFIQKMPFSDFKSYLDWHYDITDEYWGGSRSTLEIDTLLDNFYSIKWLSDSLAEITER